MTGNEIRETFLRFFEGKGHTRVRSSSLVPLGDPTLLFTNAGMNQFKNVFLGLEQRPYTRATSSQKCVRAGGKHNDLENVGFTNRHHTFFEMLGNFSFGDYFKKDAIAYAWELVTSSKWFGVPKERLYATIFKGEEGLPRDADAYDHWLATGVPPDRIIELGIKENFWAMGDTGPCGPCSEIHYDMGAAASDLGHKDCQFPCDCGRYVEIWNLVFMQFNRDAEGELNPLPKPCVDTGMGLERMAATILNLSDPAKFSNYDTDLFQPLIRRAEELTGAKYAVSAKSDASLRIIADHSRAVTFLISDGVLPSNEGRGYVLRKIIRRAIDHARLLGSKGPVLSAMALTVCAVMEQAYPETLQFLPHVSKILEQEEEKYLHLIEPALQRFERRVELAKAAKMQDIIRVGLQMVLDGLPNAKLPEEAKQGVYKMVAEMAQIALNNLGELEELRTGKIEFSSIATKVVGAGAAALISLIASVPDIDDRTRHDAEAKVTGIVNAYVAELAKIQPIISGEDLFFAYDTLGLKPDFIRDVALRAGWKIAPDAETAFERELVKQRERAKASWKGAHKEVASPVYTKLAAAYRTEPDFYYESAARDCRIEAIIRDLAPADEVKAGQEAEIVLDRTAIYAESGGQVADVGRFYDNGESLELAEVRGAYYPIAGLIAHKIVAKEKLAVGDRVATVADAERRAHIKRNHTATHLMHAALRSVLGTHVKQAGSLVAPDHLRFDFSHFRNVDPAELREIEQQVNDQILQNQEITTDILPLDEALASGALAFFGERYPEQNVRVVTIEDRDSPRGFYSKELCGGTHVHRTGDIGVFKLVGEQSVASGVRRVEAITGVPALEQYQTLKRIVGNLAAKLNISEAQVEARVAELSEQIADLQKKLRQEQSRAALSQVDDLAGQARSVKDVRVLSARVSTADRDSLRQLVDALRQKLGSGVVVLGAADDGKVALISGVTKDLTPRLHAGKIVQAVAKQVGGSGGGRPDLAEAGGKDTNSLDKAIGGVYDLIEQML
jgi:alanyl-tRNA synthetase